jgi:branched-chain amino acid transport system substrate-binding protein
MEASTAGSVSRRSILLAGLWGTVLGGAALAACGPAGAPGTAGGPGGGAAPKRMTIGFTASQTGSLTTESKRQLQGLQLWVDDVRKAGGIKLKDGPATPELKFYDDESKADRVQALYTKLITDDKVDVLISPYSSGLTQTAAVVAEQYGKVMITTGAASDTTMEQGFRNIFQLYTPASRYLTGAVDMLQRLNASLKRLAIVHEKDRFSTDVATATQTYAKGKGYDIVLFEGYDTGTVDFSPFISKIQAARPDAIMGGGHFQDGTTFAKQLYEKNVPVRLVALLVAPPEPTFAEIGDAAQYVVGPSQWEPVARYSQESARAAGVPWYGISIDDFVKAYQARFGEEPSYHAAGGYAAGLILQKGLEEAGAIDNERLRSALARLDLLTFYGRVKFDQAAKTFGKQIGHEMVYIQWQKDASGRLVKPVVWPPEGKSADPQLRPV